MRPDPTLETLAEKAFERGVKLGEQDVPYGVDKSNENPRKDISDIILLYMVFVEDMTDYSEDRSTIEIDYLVSEFLLGYAGVFYGAMK
jgi:hypothetical protein